ncbi:MAG: hypothetical protein O2887_05140 [Bacteroidetes bacterium]|nr:hypothetical protein [Bacteroidota bacterium]MDA1119867.1 hypothetical protein [Bacteroidota bacterium]
MNRIKILLSLILTIFYMGSVVVAQFGPIGYDFGDPYIEFNNLRFAVRLSTESNIYCPDKSSVVISTPSPDQIVVSSKVLSSAGGQLTINGYLEMTITKVGNNRMSVSTKGSHPTEIAKTIQVLVKGIDVKSFVSEYHQAKGVNEFVKKDIMVSYPSRSATMPLVFITTPTEEWFVLSKDKELRRKAFACSYDHLTKEPVVLLSHDEDARKRLKYIESPDWIIGSGETRLNVVEERCEDLEKNFNLIPYKEKADIKWIDELKVVSFFHGIHWTGHMFNTYEQIGDQIEWICETVDGKNVLAFLPAWDGRYYGTYPEHKPDERMGGEEGLKKLVERSHKLGAKVVLMLGGPNLSTFKFLKENDMMDAALKGADGYPQVQNWLDWNIDLSIETMGLIMNFGNPKYRDYMINKTSELFDDFDVDGVFLDGALRWDNSPDYSSYEGLIEYTSRLRRKHPSKMLMGEDGYDVIYGLFDMFHTSGGPMGLENFMLRYARQFYYLSYPAENGSAGVHEIGWSNDSPTIINAQPDFTIPTISMLNGIIDTHGETIKKKLIEYKKWRLKETPIMD